MPNNQIFLSRIKIDLHHSGILRWLNCNCIYVMSKVSPFKAGRIVARTNVHPRHTHNINTVGTFQVSHLPGLPLESNGCSTLKL